jgi:hypothetical protein
VLDRYIHNFDNKIMLSYTNVICCLERKLQSEKQNLMGYKNQSVALKGSENLNEVVNMVENECALCMRPLRIRDSHRSEHDVCKMGSVKRRKDSYQSADNLCRFLMTRSRPCRSPYRIRQVNLNPPRRPNLDQPSMSDTGLAQ